MKSLKCKFVFFAIVFLTLSFSCAVNLTSKTVKGDGNIVKKEVSISNYTKIQARSSVKVFYKQNVSAAPYLTLEIDENLWDLVAAEVKGETLDIGSKPNTSISPTKFIVYTNSPLLNSVDLSGASILDISEPWAAEDVKIQISGASKININQYGANKTTLDCSGASKFEAKKATINNFSFDLSGASKIDISELVVKENAKLNLSGAANITIGSGTSSSANIVVSGASKLNAKGWGVDNAKVNLSGASKADVTANQTIEVDASGASKLNYFGNAKLTKKSVSGASHISGN